jgi:hypothetical protein
MSFIYLHAGDGGCGGARGELNAAVDEELRGEAGEPDP